MHSRAIVFQVRHILPLLAALLPLAGAEAQVRSLWPEVHRVRWPLLDIVLVPDSSSVWFLAGPNAGTTQWGRGTNLADFGIDPVLALQWVTVARRLKPPLPGRSLPDSAARVTPPLRARNGPGFVLLGTNTEKPSADRSFILLVSDSGSRTHWKAFASAAQVDTLLTALEVTAISGQAEASGWNDLACQDPDTPVRIVSQPVPPYPSRLAHGGAVGRVWMTYVVGADGRPEPESFSALLSDDSLFTWSALDALRRSRFKPARTDGQPVRQRVFQAVVFRQR